MTTARKGKSKLGIIVGMLGGLGISGTALASFLMAVGGDAEQIKEDHKKLEAIEVKVDANELNIRESMTEQRVMFKVIKDELLYIRKKVDQ